jgi:hypothetical protein
LRAQADYSKTGRVAKLMVDLMTQASPVTRTVTFRAHAGHGPALATRLLDSAALAGEAPEVVEGHPLGGVLASGSPFPDDGKMVSDGPAS